MKCFLPLLILVCTSCAPEPQTACFESDNIPGASDLRPSPVTPGEDFNNRPQTESEAVQAMWDFLHAEYAESDPRVTCLIDEGTIECVPGVLGPGASSPGRHYWQCHWHHPESDNLPEGLQAHVFFSEDSAAQSPDG